MIINSSQTYMLALAFTIILLAQQLPQKAVLVTARQGQYLPQKQDAPKTTTYNEWPLPEALQNKGIQYEHVPHIKGWSCGFNCLINAARIEDRAGISHTEADMLKVETICKSYAAKNALKTTDGVGFAALFELASMLNLQQTTLLDIADGKVTYFNREPIEMSPYQNDSQDIILQKLQEAYTQRTLEHFRMLKAALEAKKNQVSILHFICHIVSKQEHVLLISLVKGSDNNIKFFVRDNMNKEIIADGQVAHYLQYLTNYFAKSN